MMKAPNCPGGESGLKSGTSPTHFSPFHTMLGRDGSQVFPSASAEARLYMMRRLAGHEKPHSWNMPRPVGSALLRRLALLPADEYTPVCSQLPHIVVPSSMICAKLSSCWPAAFTSLPSLSLMSTRALPLMSLSTSSRSGLIGLV